MNGKEMIRRMHALRQTFQINNRLNLEFHALLSRLLREHGVAVEDDLLGNLILAVPDELMTDAPAPARGQITRPTGGDPDLNGPQPPDVIAAQVPEIIGPQQPGIIGPQQPGIIGPQQPEIIGPQLPPPANAPARQSPEIIGPQLPGDVTGPQQPGDAIGPQQPGIIGPQQPK